ncbi:MAG: nucleotide exchange factor GrpE [Legionellales bacterium]|nr:nucleotide exchange factor GrpE [Legionellales bacterium]
MADNDNPKSSEITTEENLESGQNSQSIHEKLAQADAPKTSAFGADLSDLLDDDHDELAPLNSLQAELTAAKKEARENWEKVLRLNAEMQNLQRRTERDISNAHKFALEKFVNELLPVIDSLDSALALAVDDTPAHQAMREGMELTMKMFLDAVNKFNVIQINPVNQPFNPEIHEAMVMQEAPDVPANTVLTVVQKGYVLNERLIRPARVIVSKSTN